MSGNETLADDLLAARDALLQRGWCQDVLTDGRRVCTVAAASIGVNGRIALVGGEPEAGVRLSRVLAYLGLALGQPQMGLANWNDASERTEQEVLDLFDSAIRLAKDGLA